MNNKGNNAIIGSGHVDPSNGEQNTACVLPQILPPTTSEMTLLVPIYHDQSYNRVGGGYMAIIMLP